MTSRTDQRIKVAVAGLGAIARTAHLPLLERRRDLFELAAVADLSRTVADEIGARYGVPAEHRFTDVGEMLEAGGFDAVLLLTSGSHGAAAEDALRRGYAVFCEKPLAFTRAEIARIAAAETAQNSGPRLMVGYMKQYDPAARRMAELLEEAGGPSVVRSVEICVLHPTGESQLAFAHLPFPAADIDADVVAGLRALDDELLDAALGRSAGPRLRGLYQTVIGSISHDLSLLRMFTGAPDTVDLVSVWPRDAQPGSVEISTTLPAGGRCSIRWHYLPDYPAYRETVAVHHGQGTLELAFPAPYLMNAPTILTVTGNAGGAQRRSEFTSTVEAFEEELVAFHAMVVDGVPPCTGAAGADEDLVLAQRAAYRLARIHDLPCGGEMTQGTEKEKQS